jgi:hypothetical protein
MLTRSLPGILDAHRLHSQQGWGATARNSASHEREMTFRSARAFIFAAIGIAIVTAISISPPCASIARGDATDLFIADLDAFHVVPPTESLGTAHLDIQFVTLEPPLLRLSIRANNLSGPIVLARIHRGTPEQNGPVVFDLGTFTGARMLDWTPTAQDLSELEAGLLYVEARGRDYPRDEIRGQIHALATVPCDRCGPGDHWIDPPGCPRGTSTTSAVVTVGLDLDSDCEADTELTLFGPASVLRSQPRDDSVHYPGSTPVDGHLSVIDTEMTALSAIGGDDAIVCGAGLGTIPLGSSFGLVAERPDDPALAESFFDLYFEIRTRGLVLFNQIPVRLAADVTCLPPRAIYDGSSGCIALFTSPVPGEGVWGANLTTMSIATFLTPAGAWEHDPSPAPRDHWGTLRDVAPNPTDGRVTLSIEMWRRGRAVITLYEAGGRAIAVLLDRTLDPGVHRFTLDPASRRGSGIAAGVYLLRLDAGGFAETRKLVVR